MIVIAGRVLAVSYRALYRVWRPQQFKDLVGQEHVTTTLQNALSSGQIAHAYLFHGPRGTGKTSAAKLLAKAVNCEHGPAAEPCNQCAACRKITEGQMVDVVEIDAASNRGVDDIRELRDQVRYAPTEARYKVYIIDEAHMLTLEAFNALLKTLEEPPAHVLFVLATTEPHRLLPTIVSRCQRFAFRRISFAQIVNTIKKICKAEGVTYEEDSLLLLARSADGGLRDALSLLDQALAFAGKHLDESAVTAVTGSGGKRAIQELLKHIQQQQTTQALETLQQCIAQGAEAERLLDDLLTTCRDRLLQKTAPNLDHLQGLATEEDEALTAAWDYHQWLQALDILLQVQQQMRQALHPFLLLEMAVIRLSQEQRSIPTERKREYSELADLKQELQQLRRQLQTISKQHIAENSTQRNPSPVEQPTPPSSAPVVEEPSLATNQLSSEVLQQVQQKWQEILLRVKEQKITVHAWLLNARPVAATKKYVLLIFTSQIHRDTVARPENKQLVEQVIEQVMGFRLQLQLRMEQDWKGPEQTQAPPEKKNSTPSLVEKAIQLFGEERVKRIDE